MPTYRVLSRRKPTKIPGSWSDKLQKKGKLVESEEGELVLVNDDRQGFRADKDVIAIWNRCEGNVTSDELVEEISETSDRNPLV